MAYPLSFACNVIGQTDRAFIDERVQDWWLNAMTGNLDLIVWFLEKRIEFRLRFFDGSAQVSEEAVFHAAADAIIAVVVWITVLVAAEIK